jgi:hypothetical protein
MPEPAQPLRVKVTWDGVIATVALTGELDAASAPSMTERLMKVAEIYAPGAVVLDLRGILGRNTSRLGCLDKLIACGLLCQPSPIPGLAVASPAPPLSLAQFLLAEPHIRHILAQVQTASLRFGAYEAADALAWPPVQRLTCMPVGHPSSRDRRSAPQLACPVEMRF